MVQTIKAYKCMKTILKAYKSNMGTDHKSYISKGTNHITTEYQHINIYVNQSTIKAQKKKNIFTKAL